MNKKKPKDILTPAQFQQQLKSRRETWLTDWWLKEIGLNPDAVPAVCIEVLQAQRIAHQVLSKHANLLTPKQAHVLNNFKNRFNSKRRRKSLKPTSAIQILNLCTKIRRQAHKNELEARQKIQALRNQ